MARNERKFVTPPEDWENGALGQNESSIRKSPPELEAAIDEALGLQPISIRLQKKLIEQLKFIAHYRGIGYQPLVRDLLHRFARSEINLIASELKQSAESQKQISGVGAGDEGPAAQFIKRRKTG